MRTFIATRRRILPVVLAGCCVLFVGCKEFKQLMPKAAPARKAQPIDPDIAKELESSDKPDAEQADGPHANRPHQDFEVDHVNREDYRGPSHDLTADERSGGHTLRKHVGRTDDELHARLEQENISASSTYTDRAAAEFAVGNAIEEGKYRIEKWMQRSGGHPNLVLDYHGDQPIGRTLHRGDSASQPCSDAKVVLRWLSSSEYYVLTSYPECR